MILGIDEVGRGCWAGPLVVAAVVLHAPIAGLRDSKKLSKKRRESLAALIESQAKAYGIGWVSPAEIDKLGLNGAVRLAMLRAVKRLHETSREYSQIIIDGNSNFLANVAGLPPQAQVQTLVRADDSVPAVSAASIIAKVARDAYMATEALRYPQYGFDRHVGYGTAAHLAALKAHGVTDLHRKSFAPIRALTGGH